MHTHTYVHTHTHNYNQHINQSMFYFMSVHIDVILDTHTHTHMKHTHTHKIILACLQDYKQFNNRTDYISIIQNISYIVASNKVNHQQKDTQSTGAEGD